MKLLNGLTAFFTTALDALFPVLGLIRRGIGKLLSNRVAIVSSIVVVIKAVYDFIVAQVNKAIASFQSMPEDLMSLNAGGGIADFLAFGNCIFPISETFLVAVLLLELWIACMTVKLILRLIPCI